MADVLAKLRGWRDLPRELVMQVLPCRWSVCSALHCLLAQELAGPTLLV